MATEETKPHFTKDLCQWISAFSLEQAPSDIQTRAKYVILDGIACALVAAHLPWSAKAAEVLFAIEPAGNSTVIGWDRKLPPLAAALLNSTFIQGFELDDWHSEAPLHSNSLVLPTLFALAQHLKAVKGQTVTGKEILSATLAGFEVGPRVGNALRGTHMLSSGWHSGAIFGPVASAAAGSNFLKFSPDQVEDALGTACTQACGLMSAQFGSDAKRMQHGFAARNGLLATFLAQQGYTGIKDVFELTYGGYLKQFTAGNGKEPAYVVDELTKDLGQTWKTTNICIKAYASMAGTHPTVDCVRNLQEEHPVLKGPGALEIISEIRLILGEAAFNHGGFDITRPLSTIGAQMSNIFVAATQLIHGEVMPAQFKEHMLDDENVWAAVKKIKCELARGSGSFSAQIVEIKLTDGRVVRNSVESARGDDPRLENEEIAKKYDILVHDVIDKDRAEKIKAFVLSLEEHKDIEELIQLLSPATKNPIG